jgi:hypothetical protein
VTERSEDGFGHEVSLGSGYLIVGSPTAGVINTAVGDANQGSIYIYGLGGEPEDCYCEIIPNPGGPVAECNLGFLKRIDFEDEIFRNNWFGTSIEIFENRFVVGCPISSMFVSASYNGADYSIEGYTDEFDAGIFQLYELDSELDWSLKKQFNKRKLEGAAKQLYGRSVAMNSENILIGAPANIAYDSASKAAYDPDYSHIANLQEKFFDDVSGSIYRYDPNDLNNFFQVGNVFYKNGMVVITETSSFFGNILSGSGERGHEITFRGEHPIHETEVLVPIKPGEFNVSTNPTALINDPIILDINENGVYDECDLDLILRYLSKYKYLPSDQVQNEGGIIIEQTEDWWNNALLMTEAEDVLLLVGLDVDILEQQFQSDGSKMTKQYYDKLVALDKAGYLDFDGDGKSGFLTDGNILINYTANLRDESLIAGLTNANSIRNTPGLVAEHLDVLTGKKNLIGIRPEFHNYIESSDGNNHWII